MIPIPPVTYNPYSTCILLLLNLTHNHWIHYQAIRMATTLTLFHMTIYCLQLILVMSLFLLIQSILTYFLSPMVLARRKIFYLSHIRAYGAPCWIWPLIPSLFFQVSPDSYKRANSKSNIILLYPFPFIYMFPLF